MKNFKFIIIIALALILGGCAKTGTTDIFRFENHQVSVEVGDVKPLLVTGNFEKGDIIEYELVNSEDDIISFTVDSEDVITVSAMKPGTVTIRASIADRNVAATIIVEVILPKTSAIKIIAPDNIIPPTPEKPRYQIKLNTPVDFDFLISPLTEVNNRVIWSVEDKNHKKIATGTVIIREDGVFTAFVGGDMYIVATSLDGKTNAKLAIHVEYTPITSLIVEVAENNSEAAEVNIRNAYLRESIQLKATTNPNTANPEVVWSSSTPSVTVDPKTGLAYCNSVGTGTVSATITATSVANSSVRSSITLSFTYAPAESINLLSADLIAVVAGQSTSLNAEISPANANPSLNWTILSQNIVPIFDVITMKEIKDLALITQTGNIANMKTVYQGEVVARVVSNTDVNVYKDVIVKITKRPAPTNIFVVSSPSVLIQTANFFDDSQVRTVKGFNSEKKHLGFGREISIVAKVIPFEAYQELEFIVADQSIALVTDISAPNNKGETTIKLVPLKPGSTDIYITHKYANAYSDLENVVLTVNISEQSITLDKSEAPGVVKVGGVEFEYYSRANLSNYAFEFEEAFEITEYSWELSSEGSVGTNEAFIHTTEDIFADTYLYIVNVGTYYLKAIDDLGNVFFETKVVVN